MQKKLDTWEMTYEQLETLVYKVQAKIEKIKLKTTNQNTLKLLNYLDEELSDLVFNNYGLVKSIFNEIDN